MYTIQEKKNWNLKPLTISVILSPNIDKNNWLKSLITNQNMLQTIIEVYIDYLVEIDNFEA